MQKELPLEEIVKERFGIHRGIASKENPENSLEAIKAAVECEPPFVEFDVVLVDGEVRTGHPPRAPMDRLEKILPLFSGVRPYPKVDVWLRTSPDFSLIDLVLADLESVDLPFVLIAIGHEKSTPRIVEAGRYLARRIGDNPKIRFNIDLRYYRGMEAEAIDHHVTNLGSAVFSISPEIHQSDWEETARFAEKHQIEQICFWLWVPPDAPPERQVSEETLWKVLALEERYPVKVYFDIDPRWIEGFTWDVITGQLRRE